MAVTVTPVNAYLEAIESGVLLAHAKLVVMGLPANANTPVPHGLPRTPLEVGLEAKSNSVFWEYQAADATNIYVGVGAASGTHQVDIYVVY